MSDKEMVTIPLETLRHLFDLAMDSPLMCSGNFDSDDVLVLRATAERIHVDPLTATPDEFVRDYPHPFRPRGWMHEREPVPAPRDRWGCNTRLETEEEVMARLGTIPDRCVAGTYGRRCGRPTGDPMHVESAK